MTFDNKEKAFYQSIPWIHLIKNALCFQNCYEQDY